MKVASPMAVGTAVLLMTLLAGCSGSTPKTSDMPETPEAVPPSIQVFTGTWILASGDTSSTGTITATITGISHNGTALTGAALVAALELLGGAEHEFSFTLSEDMAITVSGDLLDSLMLAGGMVTATRSGEQGAHPLEGTWEADVEHPVTMATASITLDIVPHMDHMDRGDFTLTVETAASS